MTRGGGCRRPDQELPKAGSSAQRGRLRHRTAAILEVMPKSTTRPGAIPIYLETGKRRVFACSMDWPGWCRAGKDEQRAMEALAAAAPRYAIVAAAVGRSFPAKAGGNFQVVERLAGTASTDFGVPGEAASADVDPRGVARRSA